MNQHTNETAHAVTVEPRALARIIGEALTLVPGVLGPGGGVLCGLKESTETIEGRDLTCGVTAEARDGRVDAEILITADEAFDFSDVLENARAAAIVALRRDTGLEPGDVRVEIVDTQTADAYAARFRQA